MDKQVEKTMDDTNLVGHWAIFNNIFDIPRANVSVRQFPANITLWKCNAI